MKAWATREVPCGIVEAMDHAIEAAIVEGMTPTSIYLGPAKWMAWRGLVEEQYAVFYKEKCPANKPETYHGIPVFLGVMNGIVMDGHKVISFP